MKINRSNPGAPQSDWDYIARLEKAEAKNDKLEKMNKRLQEELDACEDRLKTKIEYDKKPTRAVGFGQV